MKIRRIITAILAATMLAMPVYGESAEIDYTPEYKTVAPYARTWYFSHSFGEEECPPAYSRFFKYRIETAPQYPSRFNSVNISGEVWDGDTVSMELAIDYRVVYTCEAEGDGYRAIGVNWDEIYLTLAAMVTDKETGTVIWYGDTDNEIKGPELKFGTIFDGFSNQTFDDMYYVYSDASEQTLTVKMPAEFDPANHDLTVYLANHDYYESKTNLHDNSLSYSEAFPIDTAGCVMPEIEPEPVPDTGDEYGNWLNTEEGQAFEDEVQAWMDSNGVTIDDKCPDEYQEYIKYITSITSDSFYDSGYLFNKGAVFKGVGFDNTDFYVGFNISAHKELKWVVNDKTSLYELQNDSGIFPKTVIMISDKSDGDVIYFGKFPYNTSVIVKDFKNLENYSSFLVKDHVRGTSAMEMPADFDPEAMDVNVYFSINDHGNLYFSEPETADTSMYELPRVKPELNPAYANYANWLKTDDGKAVASAAMKWAALNITVIPDEVDSDYIQYFNYRMDVDPNTSYYAGTVTADPLRATDYKWDGSKLTLTVELDCLVEYDVDYAGAGNYEYWGCNWGYNSPELLYRITDKETDKTLFVKNAFEMSHPELKCGNDHGFGLFESVGSAYGYPYRKYVSTVTETGDILLPRGFDPEKHEIELFGIEYGRFFGGIVLDMSGYGTVTEPEPEPEPTPEPTYEIGDANTDGKVNLTDASVMLQYIAEWEDVAIDLTTADVDSSGKVNLSDVSLLLRQLVES